MTTCLLLLLSALAEPPSAPPPDVEAMFRALGVRDPEPDCAEVEALSADPVPALLRIVDEVALPPWVPMRAAHCLAVRHAEVVRPQLDAWVRSPEKRGLMLLVVGLLDRMPREIALEVGRAALEGSDPDAARARIARLETPELRALAAAQPAP